jgi:flavin-binding protein dodecin
MYYAKFLKNRCNAVDGAFYDAIKFQQITKEGKMSESVYKIIDLVGSSPNSWEEAAKNAVETASKSLRDLRVAEVDKLDMKVEDGKVTAFRARVKLSFVKSTFLRQ